MSIYPMILKCPAADKNAPRNSLGPSSKDGEELEQVVGNAEDEIGDRLAVIRESELLYGPSSLLAVYGPMLVHICGSPQKYKVALRRSRSYCQLIQANVEPNFTSGVGFILQQIPLR
jgi:hypothetical protein